MIKLAEATSDRALYYGLCDAVDSAGHYLSIKRRSTESAWHELGLEDWACYDPSCFPGQLFNVAAAPSLGDVVQTCHRSWLGRDQPRSGDLSGASFNGTGHYRGKYLRSQVRLRKYAEEKAHRMVEQTET